MNIPSIKDTYYITYGIFYLLGILTFIPNYFVITASRYWQYKFRFMGRQDAEHPDTGPGPPGQRNLLQISFPSSYYLVSQSSLIIFVYLTGAYSKKLPPPDKRISAALLCTLVFYSVNLIFCRLVTDTFQVAFFFIVMCIACFLAVCSAVILVSLFEMVRKFPPEYYNAILTGQALCGVISALIQILTISLTNHPADGGLIFFGIGTCIVFVTIVVYWYSKKNSQYFVYNMGNDATVECTFEHRKFFPRIWMKIKSSSHWAKMCVSSLIIVVGTTAIVYPGFMALVVADGNTGDGKIEDGWVEMYFVPVITFLVASLCDLIGRLLAAQYQMPRNQIAILVLAVLRIGFLPLLALSNKQPRSRFPVLFFDIPYIIFTILFLFSNGYLINLCVTLIPTLTQTEEERTSVSVMFVISAVFAVAFSSFLSLLLVNLI
ncbi:equilibrative nucleoside transporter 2-like isoform X2 [Euwallacea fornicatus]|uniref:equilibrative nucleoside transporter 2-like isoform X2 n=1 Tax=Euwallacea fornicatus TaxID=995702 RepID=UPI00338E5458